MKKTILAMAALALIASCKKKNTETPEPTVTVEPSPTGSIFGKIKQRAGNGSTYTLSLANVTVSIDGQNKSAITNESGTYTISGVKSGILDVSIDAPDNNMLKVQQVSFVGNGMLTLNAELSRRSTDTLVGRVLDTTRSSLRGLQIYAKNQRPSYTTYSVFMTVSRTAAVDPTNPSTFEYSASLGAFSSPGTAELIIDQYYSFSSLSSLAGIKTGEQFYVTIFPSTTFGCPKDLYTNKNVCYSAGVAMAAPAGFTMP